jgi:hypothetical protein
MLDLRVPSGSFFTIVGLILCALGIFSPENKAALTEINVNLYAGVTMVVFGTALLLLARRSA